MAESVLQRIAEDEAFAEKRQRVEESLLRFGADTSAMATYIANDPSIVDLIDSFPQLASVWAKRFPSGGRAPYGEALVAYGFSRDIDEERALETMQAGDLPSLGVEGIGRDISSGLSGDTGSSLAALAGPNFNERGFTEGNNGAVRYRNGVIAGIDPQTGEPFIFYPDDRKGRVEGSPMWLERVRRSWGPEKVKKWRKRLSQLGYSISEDGAWAGDIERALRQYHQDRYINKGEVIPVAPTDTTRVDARDILGPATVRMSVREEYQRVMGRDPSDKELDEWQGFIYGTAKKLLAKGGGDVEGIRGETLSRFYESVEQDPGVQYATEAEEENTSVRDGLIATSQVFHRMAMGG